MPLRTLRAVLFVTVGTLLSCSRDLVTPGTHVLVGNAYNAASGCLNPQQSFDVVDGPAPSGTCDVVCITDAKTGTVYVTDACPPFPVMDAVESSAIAAEAGEGGSDPCAPAIAAWAAGNECGAATATDGSADAPAEAGDDATVDAPAEGSPDGSGDDASGDAADATNEGDGGSGDAGGNE
jgi:hypothetical protein